MEIKNSSIIAGLVIVVALPATTSVIAYQITKDPTLRPLARTLNDEAIYNGSAISNEISAIVHWTTGRAKNFTQQDLSIAVQRAFGAHGVDVRMVFRQVDTAGPVTITYKVGRNTFGPTRITRAADSIKGAIAVFRMYKMVNS